MRAHAEMDARLDKKDRKNPREFDNEMGVLEVGLGMEKRSDA